MHCPSCGGRLAQALSYCNHCGASLSSLNLPGDKKTAESTSDTLVWVIVGTTITLLGMALGALVLMKDGTIDRGLGTAFVILSFVAFGLVEAVLVWRLLYLNARAKGTSILPEPKESSIEQSDPAPVRRLQEPAEPVSSVTDQTTRSFEPSYRERGRR